MKKINNTVLVGLFLGIFGLVAICGHPVEGAETRKKLQTGILQIMTDVDVNDNDDGASGDNGVSDTIDLSGGRLDNCDFQVSVTSGACSTCTLDFTVQSSADGGTTWATAGTFTQITSSASATEAIKSSISVAPGNKARVINALSSATTFYAIDMWAVCNAD